MITNTRWIDMMIHFHVFTEHNVSIHSRQWKKYLKLNWLTLIWQPWPPPDVSRNAVLTCTTVWMNFAPFIFTKLLQFSSILDLSGLYHFLEVMPKHLSLVEDSRRNIFLYWRCFFVDLHQYFESLSCPVTSPQLLF